MKGRQKNRERKEAWEYEEEGRRWLVEEVLVSGRKGRIQEKEGIVWLSIRRESQAPGFFI